MHDLVSSFDERGIVLNPRLVQMLDEHCSHQTERRGCGYTQATRFLSTYINVSRDPDQAPELGVFAGWRCNDIGSFGARLVREGWPHGWRRLSQLPASLMDRVRELQISQLVDLLAQLGLINEERLREESRILLQMVRDLLNVSEAALPILPPMPLKPEIGSCSQAEEYFLEISHGKIRRGGSLNLVIDDRAEPLMIEKMNLGESHSAILLKSARLNGVAIPPGALLALKHAQPDPGVATAVGRRLELDDVGQARFLRLTTLSVPPGIRRRAFSSQVAAQVRSNMVSPLTTTLDDLRNAASRYAEVG